MAIFRHYLRMLASAVGLVFAVIVVMFGLLELSPGDPVQALVGDMPVTDEFRVQMNEQYGRDRPAPERFLAYVLNVLRGDLGYSFANQEPVGGLIVERLGNTLLLTIRPSSCPRSAGSCSAPSPPAPAPGGSTPSCPRPRWEPSPCQGSGSG